MSHFTITAVALVLIGALMAAINLVRGRNPEKSKTALKLAAMVLAVIIFGEIFG